MTLDLHGVPHGEVGNLVYEYIIKASQTEIYFTCFIITGNSTEMKRLVKEEINKHSWVKFIDDLKPGKIFIYGV